MMLLALALTSYMIFQLFFTSRPLLGDMRKLRMSSGFALGAAYGHVVAAAFEPRDAAARDALGVVRVEGEEGDECFLYVFLGLPVRLGSVFLGVEEVFAAR